MAALDRPSFGATLLDDAVRFAVWAPFAETIEVRLFDGKSPRVLPMKRKERGCFEAVAEGVPTGALYLYRIDGAQERPDPYSRFQPEGVHGPSEIVDPLAFGWSDADWGGTALSDFIVYELHVGAATPEGRFESILPRLSYLRDELGVTAVEIMPVAQFPGKRNWGYDGVHLFAPQNSYGGPVGLKRLIDACHRARLAVILDVVYNHLGPEGNYLRDFGPYFTSKYKTPWGEAVNYDGAGSDFVRRYVLDNALYWIAEYHVDALRLDAVHAIYDFSPKHILRQMKEEVEAAAAAAGRSVYLIAESDLNDPKVIRSPQEGGFGLDAQWNDDFHHALHTLLTGERQGYYQDFGRLDQMGRAIRDGFVIAGSYSSFRDRTHGRPLKEVNPARCVVFSQNHDQIGNRILGERLSTLVSFEAARLAAAMVLLSPNIPLLFMGEEYGETAPFLFFTDYQDPPLAEGVRRGRGEEARAFGWRGAVADPQSKETFLRSKIDPAARYREPGAKLFSFYQRLIALRKEEPALRPGKRNISVEVFDREKILVIVRPEAERRIARGEAASWMIFSFNAAPASFSPKLPKGIFEKCLDGEERAFGGRGRLLPSTLSGLSEIRLDLAPFHVAVYRRSR